MFSKRPKKIYKLKIRKIRPNSEFEKTEVERHLHEDALAGAELVADDGVGRPQHAPELPEAWPRPPLPPPL